VKRITLLVVVGALLLTMVPGVASAAVIRCDTLFCFGTNSSDTMYERVGNGLNDNIYGLRGGDVVNADRYTNDRDRLYGGRGNDRLNTNDNDGRDLINCGKGKNDKAILDRGDNVNHKNCESIRRR
jgi:hypothetical protein